MLVSRNFGFVCGVFLWCFGVPPRLAGLKSVGWVIFWWLLCLVWVGCMCFVLLEVFVWNVCVAGNCVVTFWGALVWSFVCC